MSSLDDSGVLRRAKALAPRPVKRAVGAGVRLGGAATAALRPGPDLLVVGAKRSGTTFLWSALLAHPQVMPMLPAAQHIKSPHWFTRHQGMPEAWYRGHFPTVAARERHRARHGGAFTVEADPLYLWDPRVAERARHAVPDARVVVLLRDPVARAHSHYRERVKAGVERLDFLAALDAEDARLAGEPERMADARYYARAWDWYSYRARGEYAPQVRRWQETFGSEQVLVLRSEDLYADPAATLARVQSFAGLDVHAPTSTRRNAVPGADLPPAAQERLREHFAPHTHELARLLGTGEWW
ncbi:sulfotransferase [Nocardioides zeae]|uniref:Sulfotransferase n=1 Tax=Nocardioides imazamoxiresistens TaxID=3231893 RepID=A0ABU3PYQ7_9ACTN|nr:sulfotransferase [Nocardioides zeae]MDT9594393.1 sulfotransferase [Nocardioides zeae]